MSANFMDLDFPCLTFRVVYSLYNNLMYMLP